VFDPIRIYDKPSVILTQLGNGIATTDSVRRTLLDPAALSPRERQSYLEGLKKSTGDNPVVDTVLDVVGNPLTWLAFVAGGAMATKNFARSGRMFTGGIKSAGYGEWAKSKWPFLRGIRALSAAQELHNTPIPALLEGLPGQMQATQAELSGYVTPALEKVLEGVSRRHNVKVTSLDPSMAPNAAVEQELEVIRRAMQSKLAGLDVEGASKYVSGLKPMRYEVMTTWRDSKGELKREWIDVGSAEEFKKFERAVADNENNALFHRNEKGVMEWGPFMDRTRHDSQSTQDKHEGKYRGFQVVDPDTLVRGDSPMHSGLDIEYVTMPRGRMVGDVALLNQDVAKYGLGELIDGIKKLKTATKSKIFGDEEHFKRTGEFVPDNDKILRVARGSITEMEKMGVIGKDGRLNYDSAAIVNSLLTEEVAGALVEYSNKYPGRGMTANEIQQLLVDTYKIMLDDPHYMPRNTTTSFQDVGGSRVEVEPSSFSRPGSYVEGFNKSVKPGPSTRMRVRESIPIDPHDLDALAERYGETPELRDARARAIADIKNQQMKNVRGTYKVHTMAPDISIQKYIVTSARDAALFSTKPFDDPAVLAALRDYPLPKTNIHYPGPTGEKGIPATRRASYINPENQPAGGFSMYDIIDTHMLALEEQAGSNTYIVKAMNDHVLPSLFGYRSVEDGATHAMSSWLRGKMFQISNSDFFKAVEKHGGVAERFVRSMRRYGSSAPTDSTALGGEVAKMFYGSTMGLNLSTAMTNLLQPLHNLHQLGFKNTVRAYAQTIEQMYEYSKARASLGPGASPAQIEAAMDSTMYRKLAGNVRVNMREISDISNAWDAVEKPGFGAQITKGNGVFEMVMKPFQITEMVNRLATGNAVLNAAEEGWIQGARSSKLDPYRAVQEARSAVEAMQFGSSPLNRPLMFYTDYLRNPAIRQFLQFPVRSAVNIVTMPGMIGGSRQMFGREISNPVAVWGLDTMRMLGVSAIAYEIGKNMLGADISKGLAVGFMPDIDVDKDKELQLPVPPFADAMYSGIRSIMAGGDRDVMADVIPLMLPAGVSISRALGAMPKSETLQALGLQKRYAAWDQRDEEGNVPIFDQDSRLLGMYSGSDIVLRAMGTDMGRFNNQTEVTQFLLKNRDQMREQRREWIASVLANNMSKAAKIKANYERQFGMPLTVTQQQMKEAVKIREESVAGRTVNTMDKDLQQQYKDVLSESVPSAMSGPKYPIEQGAMYVWSNLPKR